MLIFRSLSQLLRAERIVHFPLPGKVKNRQSQDKSQKRKCSGSLAEERSTAPSRPGHSQDAPPLLPAPSPPRRQTSANVDNSRQPPPPPACQKFAFVWDAGTDEKSESPVLTGLGTMGRLFTPKASPLPRYQLSFGLLLLWFVSPFCLPVLTLAQCLPRHKDSAVRVLVRVGS